MRSVFHWYKGSELSKLFESFKAHIDDLGMQHQDVVILSWGDGSVGGTCGENRPSWARYDSNVRQGFIDTGAE